MPTTDLQKIHERYKRLSGERAPWLNHFEEIAEFYAPRRMGFVGRLPGGEKRTRKLYNPIGVVCVTTLASALHGMVMNPAQRWMSLRMVDDELNDREDVRAWLDDVTKRLLNFLQSPSTAFHVHVNQVLEDMASFGTANMYIGQQQTGPLFVRSYSVGHTVIAENQYGMVDTVMRECDMTARQMVHEWGNSVSTKVREDYDKGNYEKEHRVVHACMPREDYDSTKRDPINMPVASIYFEPKAEHMVEESGVEEMPYVTPRWAVATGESYGRSPAMTALPAVKVANAGQKIVLDAAEKAVNPPLVLPHEGMASPVRATPGGLTYVRNRQEITQLPTSANLPFAAEWLQAINNEIRTTMFVDQLQFVHDFKMTATEVLQRQSEKMRLLAPVLGRLENELLNPLVTRAFGMLSRMRMLPPPPDDIEDADMRVEYVSPLARAQKQQLADGFVQAMAVLEPIAKINPDIVFGPIEMNKLTPMVFEWFGVDTDLLKQEDTMAQDQQRANIQRMVQQLPLLAQAIQGGGKGIESLAKAGQAGAETTAMMAQLQQMGMMPQGQGQGGGAPIDLATLMGATARGAGGSLPRVVGNTQQLMQTYQGR